MHEHDINLIQALAEGELTGAAATAAETEIAACPQCSRDLALQRRAIDALAAAPRMYLSAGESAGLRAAIRRELKLEGDVIQLKRRERRRLPLSALAGAAAVLLAVVVIAPQLDLLGSGDDDSVLTLEELGDAFDTPAPASGGTEPPVALAPPAVPAPEEADAPALQAPPRNDSEFSTAQPPAAMVGAPETQVDLENVRNLYIEFEGDIPEDSLAAVGVFSPEAADAAFPEDAGVRLDDATTPCDLSAIAGASETATHSVLGLTFHQESPAFVVAFEGESAGDVVLTVLDVETCELLEQR
jgi:anti-sigma factor RsiW